MEEDVLILGAGISGLTAGRVLQDAGKNVLLVDKGRGVGGRVATRWKGTRDHIEGRWDHGAQFVTLRSPRLNRLLETWGARDTLEDWLPAHSDPSLMRRRPLTGMNTFAKALADGLTIQRASRITHLEQTGSGWTASTEDGVAFHGKLVISTIPMPQFRDLAEDSNLPLSSEEQDLVASIEYERCLSLLAETESPFTLEHQGYLRVDSGVLETVIAHQQKGISPAPTLTAHATPAFSMEWYDRHRETAASVMRAALQEVLDVPLVSASIHGWKFAKAVQRIPQPYLTLESGMVLAGDGFEAGDEGVPADLHPRMESAMLSGLHAAEALI